MTDDVAKLADKLNENMTHAVMHAWKGGIHCDVSLATQRALVKRGLAAWDSEQENGADLTPLGLQVQDYLKQQAEAKSAAKDRERAEAFALGRSSGQSDCVSDLYSIVYPGDSWPDRPLDTIWEHLLEQVRKAFAS